MSGTQNLETSFETSSFVGSRKKASMLTQNFTQNNLLKLQNKNSISAFNVSKYKNIKAHNITKQSNTVIVPIHLSANKLIRLHSGTWIKIWTGYPSDHQCPTSVEYDPQSQGFRVQLPDGEGKVSSEGNPG